MIPERTAGSRLPIYTLTWQRRDLTTPDFSSGFTLTGTIKNTRTRQLTAITGVLTITGANIFTWYPSTADVATAGRYLVRFVMTADSDGAIEYSFEEPWELNAL
jgi:hypothetical protein